MAEVYSSLFKGLVHVTTPYSKDHTALDLGNYKTRNPIYSPNKFGKGKVTKQTSSYTYNGITYTKVLTQWITYDSGFESCTVHGHIDDKILNVGDIVQVGQLVYRTGNMGYSKGDHLHFQLKLNGVLVDPSQYVLNDENVSLFKIGDKIQITGEQNIRQGSGTSYPITGSTKIGEIYEIEDGPRTSDGYTWYDLKNNNWVADVGKFKLFIEEESPVDCQKEIDRLLEANRGLSVALGASEDLLKVRDGELSEARGTIKLLEANLEEAKNDYANMEDNYTKVLEAKERIEQEKLVAQEDLDILRQKTASWEYRLADILYGFFNKK